MKILSRGPVFEHILVLNGLVGKHCLMDKLIPFGQVSPRKVLVLCLAHGEVLYQPLGATLPLSLFPASFSEVGHSGPADVPCLPYRRLIPTLTSINRKKNLEKGTP